MSFRSAVVALLLAVPAPGFAQLVNPMTMTTDPADRAVMGEVGAAVASSDIAPLNVVLAKLPRPTPLRGMVQTVRALLLSEIAILDRR